MASYIRFYGTQAPAKGTDIEAPDLLVEVAATEVTMKPDGVTQKAGLRDIVQGAIGQAHDTLQDVLATSVRINADAFLNALDSLPKKPSSAELSFVLKITGEAGNVAVGKIGGEANYSVKLVWSEEPVNR